MNDNDLKKMSASYKIMTDAIDSTTPKLLEQIKFINSKLSGFSSYGKFIVTTGQAYPITLIFMPDNGNDITLYSGMDISILYYGDDNDKINPILVKAILSNNELKSYLLKDKLNNFLK